MSHYVLKPTGQVSGPLMIMASVALLLGFAADYLAVFRVPEGGLQAWWEQGGVTMTGAISMAHPIGVLAGAAVSFALVGSLLSVPGGGRRAVIGSTAFLLSLGLVPVLGVWGVFWSPFGFSLTTLWAWLSASVYANGHIMPCEQEAPAAAENVISLASHPETRRNGEEARG